MQKLPMSLPILRLTAAAAVLFSLTASADTFTLEPDNYANQADLTHAIPQVTLLLAISSDNQTVVPSWDISANNDSYASTGGRVFGYLGVFPSLWDGRRLRMDFASPVSSVSIDFISSFNDSGELHIFDSNWHELGTGLLTPTLAAHQVETMNLSSLSGDIAHAVAYSHSSGFGRLDNLQFTALVPEPPVTVLGAVFAASFVLARGRRRNALGD